MCPGYEMPPMYPVRTPVTNGEPGALKTQASPGDAAWPPALGGEVRGGALGWGLEPATGNPV
jgi:hypothetical protein